MSRRAAPPAARLAPAALLAMLALAAAVLVAAEPGGAASIAQRTTRLSAGINGLDADGLSRRPAISEAGGLVVFDSSATNLALDPNGNIRDVFARDVGGRRSRLVSEAIGGGGGDGPSERPAVDKTGARIAFQSAATNLVAGDANGRIDIFVRGRKTPAERISVPAAGGEANGDSTDPDISADGARVVFVSTASNLVEGDFNGVADIFVRDLTAGTTRRASASAAGEGGAASSAPAISGDGRFVTFASAAGNLVGTDANGIPDVFVADLQDGSVERVSVSSREGEQNRAVTDPFVQVSDISRTGRYVVFDSDATNLVPGDTNRDTDVFLRDRRKGTTQRVSVDARLNQGDNDSFFPSISPDGHFVAFESFAGNLVPGDPKREDVFVYDVERLAPVLVSVTDRNAPRGPEQVEQLLQRPVLSADARYVAFTSTSGKLVAGDGNIAEDVFLRSMKAPKARIIAAPRGVVGRGRAVLRLGADDPAARRFICSIDKIRIACGRRTVTPPLPSGRHVLRVRAGGPGMLYQADPVTRRFAVR